MPFFLRGNSGSGRKSSAVKQKRKHPTKNFHTDQNQNVKRKSKFEDEEITSDEDDEYLRNKFQKSYEEHEEEDEETAQEKKVRLAHQYLQQLKEQKTADSEEDEESDRLAIGQVLRDEVLDAAGRLYKPVADTLTQPDPSNFLILKCKHQKLPITCITVTQDGKFIFSASKDSSIIKWSIEGKRIGHICSKHRKNENGHSSSIYSIAVSTDNKYLASGDMSGLIKIWNPETLLHVKDFKRNKSAVSGLSFRQGTHTLYSCSHDRNVMVWNLDVMAFVEHLGGHASAITGIDALGREACITSGGRDETVIIYQIVEDKQLLFNSRQGSIDGIKLINDKTFVTYGQDGSLALWTTMKKKPHYVIKDAHGLEESNGQSRWLTAITALVNSDLVATGSSDGFIRLWKVGMGEEKKIYPLFSIPAKGFINSLAFTSSGSHLIVGIGQEHKLGRWYRDPTSKNSIVIIPISKVS